MKKHYIKKVASYSMVGSLGFAVIAGLQGCGEGLPPVDNQQDQNGTIADAAAEGYFMIIQQTGTNPDTFELKERYPSSQGTRAILRNMSGEERVLDEAELTRLAEEEAQKVEAGTSDLSRPVAQNQGGLGLGEMILASAAGALLGNMLANKMMGNRNFQQHQQRTNQRVQSSMSSTRKPAQNKTSNKKSGKRSGFFGGSGGSNRGGGLFGG